MKKSEVVKMLKTHKPRLNEKFGIVDLALFGSFSRDDASAESGIDILVRFNGPASSSRYFGLQFYLEDLFGMPVDLVTEKALRPELRPFIEKEAIYV